MTWVQLTDSQVLAATSKERASIAAIKGRDDLAEVLAGVVESFREAMAARGRTLGAAGTIPSGYRMYATNMALWQFITGGVPKNDAIHTKERADLNRAAEDFLQSLREGKADPSSSPSFGCKRRGFTKCDEDGI